MDIITNPPANWIITNPPANWMERLRKGHCVYLVKEQEMASVEFPYEPAEPGTRIGRIGIQRFGAYENRWLDIQSWYVSSEGLGLDGLPLMQPLVGNLPDNPDPLPEPMVRRLQRAIEHLEHRVEMLEQDQNKDLYPFFGR